MRFVIVTGMSGAGKTTALKMLEDMGYFCVDNLPIAMFPGFVQMIENSETPMKKVALGVDVRSGQDISGLEKDLEIKRGSNMRFCFWTQRILYL